MWIVCDKCRTGYEIRDELGGRLSRCKCGASIVLPIADPQRLIEWAQFVSWPILFRFVTSGGARGHSSSTVHRLIRTFEYRRWGEEERFRVEHETQKLADREIERQRLEVEEKSRLAKALECNRQLATLWQCSPQEFELFVADVFRAQGFEAFAVGQCNDGGVDVEIYDSKGEIMLAVVQCKRYRDKKVASKHIREFAGAFAASEAEKGYFVTTSEYTKQALATAQNFEWLKLYDGQQFVQLIASVYEGTFRKR